MSAAPVLPLHSELPLDAGRLFVRGAPLRQSAVVVVVQRNNAAFIDDCIESILAQDYADLGLAVLDDDSEDGTVEILERILPSRKVAFVRNTIRRRKFENTLFALRRLVERPESVVFIVDGDDRLLRPTAVSEMMKLHVDVDVAWSQFRFSDGRRGFCAPCPDAPRAAKWRTSHLKSFKRGFFDLVRDRDLRDETGRIFGASEDMAYMFPMLEMAGPRGRAFYDEELYFYRVHGRNMRRPAQLDAERIIRARAPYREL